MEKQHKTMKFIRQKNNITQQQISTFLGLSERNYREKENGKSPFSQLEIMKIIRMFDLKKDELFQLFFINGFSSHFWKSDEEKNSYKQPINKNL